nr:hypothetical protein [Tanacetum cinerariifolium]
PLPASPPILPIPLPAASPPLQLLYSDRRADRPEDTQDIYGVMEDAQGRQTEMFQRVKTLVDDSRADRPEVTLLPRKRLSIVHHPGYEAGESSAAATARPIEGRRADYRFVSSVEVEIRRRIAEDIGYVIGDAWIDPRDVAEEEALTTLEGVNTRVTELAAEARCSREAWEHSIGVSSTVHFELQGYMTHTWVQDQRIDAQDTLIATLTTQLSSLQGHLVMALGEIQALQAREQARAGAPEGVGSST